MKHKDIDAALRQTGLPVAFNFWPGNDIPPLPYIVFTYPQNDGFYADNVNYVNVVQMEVGLYCKNKSIATEKAVERVLNEQFGAFLKTSMYVTADAVQETLYTMEVIVNDGEQN